MSYHQGSVWPLFTGWGSLAEYRANQPLPAQQMLMQNVDLTWAQDPGAVTELLSGDYFVPFGRSTSHQLWSSAMVITPTLRGLFGINLDAATNTITLNPRLPADWPSATIRNLHIGDKLLQFNIHRERDHLHIQVLPPDSSHIPINLRSDIPGAKSIPEKNEITIPLPAVELTYPDHALPVPGSRPQQIKVLSAIYGARSLKLKVMGQPNTNSALTVRCNQKVYPQLTLSPQPQHSGAHAGLFSMDPNLAGPHKEFEALSGLNLHFPLGEGWQTLELTLTW